jgi:hypothetical protein
VEHDVLKCTVLDGELIKAKEDLASILVVHDAFCVEGMSVTNLNFSLRIQVAQRLCEKMQHKLISTIYIACKRFTEATPQGIKNVHTPTFVLCIKDKPFRTIKADGVVFVRDDQPAHNQRDDVVIKWKETSECTLDFHVGEDGFTLYLHHNDSLFPSGRSVSKCVSGISEFSMQSNGEWKFIKERGDRHRPNSAASAIQTLSFKSVCKTLWQDLIS